MLAVVVADLGVRAGLESADQELVVPVQVMMLVQAMQEQLIEVLGPEQAVESLTELHQQAPQEL
jgi:hypothetical protein